MAKFGIRVIEIMPGPIETDMLLASDKPAAAIEHERYRAQAEQLWEGRQRIRSMYTPAPEAARRIVDAILDDDGPLRAGCDDMSEGMLAAWRNAAPTRPGCAPCSPRSPHRRDHRTRGHCALRRGCRRKRLPGTTTCSV